MKAIVTGLLFAALAFPAAGQDYERERRWEKEVLSYLMVGDAVHIASARGPAFLGLHAAGEPGKPAVVLVHGLGVHPDHGIIGKLRAALSDMGFETLSIQMPVLAAETPGSDYPPLFPEAGARITAAAAWLRAKGQQRIVLLSHSMGSWMSQSYFESAKDAPFAAWICMGRSGELGAVPGLKVPVLDLYGENDYPAVLQHAAARRVSMERIPGSRQVVIAGADHFFAGREKELSQTVRAFIEGLGSP
jgi:pimeloyl-ACP methyl ester carboxylesterase